MVRITGKEGVSVRLSQMAGPDKDRQIGAALFAAGEMLAVEAQTSITNGSVSGKGHVPSAPGEPPNNDTGVLANNIEVTRDANDRTKVLVSSNAPYASYLEFGTSRMAERPYMRPATEKIRPKAVELVARAMAHVKRGGKVV